MEIIFYTCLSLIIYTYFGYPLVLIFLTIGKKKTEDDPAENLPTVSFIISAHNEEAIIEKKILNTLDCAYPRDLIEIIVASDGSQDATPKLVRKFESRGIKLVEFIEHVGKTTAQNEAVRRSTGEILVFSDANSMFDSLAVKELVMGFVDEHVGCVCGELRYRNSESSSVGKSESAYWRYEQFCKKHESQLGSLLGVNGAIYSVRRSCFIELDNSIISDFILPMEIYEKKYKVLYCSTAIAYENPSNSYGNEFRRKKRIIVRSLYGLLKNSRFLNPFSFGFFSIEIWSHKLLRWFVPVFLIGMLVTNIFLIENDLFFSIFIIQLLFYSLAAIGMIGGEKARSFSLIYIPYYFSVINLAAFIAIVELAFGKRYRTWNTDRV